jgi:hypothetical protein
MHNDFSSLASNLLIMSCILSMTRRSFSWLSRHDACRSSAIFVPILRQGRIASAKPDRPMIAEHPSRSSRSILILRALRSRDPGYQVFVFHANRLCHAPLDSHYIDESQGEIHSPETCFHPWASSNLQALTHDYWSRREWSGQHVLGQMSCLRSLPNHPR